MTGHTAKRSRFDSMKILRRVMFGTGYIRSVSLILVMRPHFYAEVSNFSR